MKVIGRKSKAVWSGSGQWVVVEGEKIERKRDKLYFTVVGLVQ